MQMMYAHSFPYQRDNRVVMTLDAGGTNLVFSAVKGTEEIIKPITRPSRGDNLEQILQSIIHGFKEIRSRLSKDPVAISFCFPGPAEYNLGIIGDLENLPAFRNGVALGPMLEGAFDLPVFINNDGDLFAYGEALAGILPEINRLLGEKGSPKRYENLLGVTFGTGFGAGIVFRGELFTGDNCAAGEINRTRNRVLSDCSVEESVSIHGVRRVYAREAGLDINRCPAPKEIFEIGIGRSGGDRAAARKAFEELAVAAGDALANAATLVDGLVVIGGGLAGAHTLFLPRLVEDMNRPFRKITGSSLNRMESRVFNLEDKEDLTDFIEGDVREIPVPFSNRKIKYDSLKRIGVGVTRLGTTRAVSIGAYAFALNKIDGN